MGSSTLIEIAKRGHEYWNKLVELKKDFEGIRYDSITDEQGIFFKTDFYDFTDLNFNEPELQEIDFANFKFDLAADFSNCTFGEKQSFRRCDFEEEVYFHQATFISRAKFNKSAFKAQAYFDQCTFGNDALFRQCLFRENVTFFQSDFAEYIDFNSSTFSRGADLSNIRCDPGSTLTMSDSHFSGALRARGAFFGSLVVDHSIFDERLSFYRTEISGITSFTSSTFNEQFSFSCCKLSKTVDCSSCEFRENAHFEACIFEEPLEFNHSVFSAQASLNGSSLKSLGAVGVALALPPDLIGTRFDHHISLSGIHIPSIRQCVKTAKQNNISDIRLAEIYRRLKTIAVESGDHENELNFFASELMMKQRRLEKGPKKLLYRLYAVFSDYGKSVSRPLIGLISTILISALIFLLRSGDILPLFPRMEPALTLAAALATPVFGFSGSAIGGSLIRLYGKDAELTFDLWLLMGIESLLSLIFIFLIGLAIRNRFRI